MNFWISRFRGLVIKRGLRTSTCGDWTQFLYFYFLLIFNIIEFFNSVSSYFMGGVVLRFDSFDFSLRSFFVVLFILLLIIFVLRKGRYINFKPIYYILGDAILLTSLFLIYSGYFSFFIPFGRFDFLLPCGLRANIMFIYNICHRDGYFFYKKYYLARPSYFWDNSFVTSLVFIVIILSVIWLKVNFEEVETDFTTPLQGTAVFTFDFFFLLLILWGVILSWAVVTLWGKYVYLKIKRWVLILGVLLIILLFALLLLTLFLCIKPIFWCGRVYIIPFITSTISVNWIIYKYEK